MYKELLHELKKSIDSARKILQKTSFEEYINELKKVLIVLEYIRESLLNSEISFISSETLTNIKTRLINVNDNLNFYSSSHNEKYIKDLDETIDEILPYLSQVQLLTNPQRIESLKESIISFNSVVEQNMRDIKQETKNLYKESQEYKGYWGGLGKQIEQTLNSSEQLYTDIQNRFSEFERDYQKRINHNIEDIISQNKNKIINYEDSFKQMIDRNQEKFAQFISSATNQLESQQNNVDNNFDNLRKSQHNEFEEVLNSLKSKTEEAEKLLSSLSIKGLASGYQDIANEEKNSAKLWSFGSILSLILVLGMVAFMIFSSEQNLEIYTLVTRFLFTAIGVTLFTYCSKQANDYKTSERKNRQKQLELASLNPYLKDLDEKDQQDIKVDLVNKYFGTEMDSALVKENKLKNS